MVTPWRRIADLEAENRRLTLANSDLLDTVARQASHASASLAVLDRLCDGLLALKKEGFNPPAPIVQPVEPVTLPGAVLSEIADKARSGTALYWELYNGCAEQLANGIEEGEVVQRLRRGGDAPEGYD